MADWKPGDPMRISLDVVKDAKVVKCNCGGAFFTEKLMFKKLSALISPTGKEELYPMQVMVCDSCGKVPRDMNPYDMVDEEYLAKKKISK